MTVEVAGFEREVKPPAMGGIKTTAGGPGIEREVEPPDCDVEVMGGIDTTVGGPGIDCNVDAMGGVVDPEVMGSALGPAAALGPAEMDASIALSVLRSIILGHDVRTKQFFSFYFIFIFFGWKRETHG